MTGENAVPVLEAAHIQPYMGPASNHLQNGLVLRSDLHRLYDAGYVTVTPDLRLEVSGRLREEFENGKAYYEMAGRPVRPPATGWPSPAATRCSGTRSTSSAELSQPPSIRLTSRWDA